MAIAEWRAALQDKFSQVEWKSTIALSEFEQHKAAFVEWLKTCEAASEVPLTLWRSGFMIIFGGGRGYPRVPLRPNSIANFKKCTFSSL